MRDTVAYRPKQGQALNTSPATKQVIEVAELKGGESMDARTVSSPFLNTDRYVWSDLTTILNIFTRSARDTRNTPWLRHGTPRNNLRQPAQGSLIAITVPRLKEEAMAVWRVAPRNGKSWLHDPHPSVAYIC